MKIRSSKVVVLVEEEGSYENWLREEDGVLELGFERERMRDGEKKMMNGEMMI